MAGHALSPARRRIAAMTVPLACLAAAGAPAAYAAPGPGCGYLVPVLLVAALLAALRCRRSQSPAGISGMWELPAVVLVPPVFAVAVPAAAAAVAGWPARRAACTLDAAAAGLAGGAVSAAFHAAVPPQPPGTAGGEWLLAVAAAGVLRQVLACVVSPLVTRGTPLPDRADSRELALGGLAELCAGILVTGSAVLSPLCVLLAVPLATPLVRSRQHAQLARAARTDRKTGLLNAAAWQDAAAAETTRAIRARLPLAMVLPGTGHFKAVNDTHGHLAGDQVLRGIAGIIRSQLRGYDIAGRFGGEEFAVLLPHTQPGRARQIAERLRISVAAAHLTASSGGGPAARVRVTVSAGVACLAECGPGLQALIAAADAALYEAKAAGRDRVRTWRCHPSDPAATAGQQPREGCGAPGLEAAPRRLPAGGQRLRPAIRSRPARWRRVRGRLRRWRRAGRGRQRGRGASRRTGR
jgi:diguanylate cyclase (GGDEF)-like protein